MRKFTIYNLQFTIIFLIISFLFLAFPGGVFAQTATLSLDPSSGTFNKGCTFSIKVNLDTAGIETDGTDAILVFDPTRMTGQNIVSGSIYPDFPGNNTDPTGKITISGLASVSTPFKGQGTLATVNFKVPDTAPTGAALINFDFTRGSTTDSNVIQRGTIVDVLGSVTGGNYTIGTGACTTQPVVTSAPTAAPGAGTGTGTGASSGSNAGGSSININAGSPGTTTQNSGSIPMKTLPNGGTQELTYTIAIVGGVLTVLGILGLALL